MGKSERQIILESARRVMRGEYMFQGTWDMEPTWTPYTFKGPVNWDMRPWDDEEWTFMLARCAFVADLAKAEVIEDDSSYGDKAMELILAFKRDAPLTPERTKTCWRTLDSGIRASNWVDAVEILSKRRKLPESFLSEFREALAGLVAYLRDKDTPFLQLSNWGLIGDSGLLKAACCLGDKEAAEVALKRIVVQCRLQVLPDGFHWEASPMYQAEVLFHLLDDIEVLGKQPLDCPPEIIQSASALAWSFVSMMTPSGRQPLQADSDETPLGGLLARAAAVLGDGGLKRASRAGYRYSKPPFLFDEGESKAYDRLKAGEIPFTSVSASVSGNHYLRSGWKRDDTWIHLKGGSHGGGHGHGDTMHVDISLAGRDIFCDCGRFTYMEVPIRGEFKLASRHNSVVIDGDEPFVPDGSWGWSRLAAPLVLPMEIRRDWAMAQASHLGWMGKGVLPLRRCFLIGKVAVIVDLFHGPGEHLVERRFHFHPSIEPVWADGRWDLGEGLSLFAEGLASVGEADFSPRYNQIRKTRVLKLSKATRELEPLFLVVGEGVKSCRWGEVRSLHQNRVMAPDEARSLEIGMEDGCDISLILALKPEAASAGLLSAVNIPAVRASVAAGRGGRVETFAF